MDKQRAFSLKHLLASVGMLAILMGLYQQRQHYGILLLLSPILLVLIFLAYRVMFFSWKEIPYFWCCVKGLEWDYERQQPKEINK
jgi:hypothetical protein